MGRQTDQHPVVKVIKHTDRQINRQGHTVKIPIVRHAHLDTEQDRINDTVLVGRNARKQGPAGQLWVIEQ